MALASENLEKSKAGISDSPGVAGRRVLVTGATGFIGGRLCTALLAKRAKVFGVSRRPPNRADGIDWIEADLGDRQAVDDMISAARPDLVFHLASHVVGARDVTLVEQTYRDNLSSTVHLLTSITQHGCRRFVMTGSLEEPDNPLEPPSSPYAAAKSAASGYCRMFHQLYGTPIVLARLFMVYGPGQRDLRKLIPYLILSLLRKETPALSSGTREIDWIYVDDVVEGLIRMAITDGVEGSRFDLGSGELISIRELVTTLYRLIAPTSEPPFGTLADRPHEQVRVADVDNSNRISWHPSTSLEEGLAATVEWYRQQLADGKVSPRP